jgi:putative ABC transport system permease protein
MFFRLLKESLLFAYNSVIVNKLRTFLSLFGITIGIFAIITVFTVLDWMESSIRENIASLGDNTIYVHKWPWGMNPDMKWWEIIKRPVPTYGEYEELKSRLSTADEISFAIQTNIAVKYKNNSAENVTFFSYTFGYENIRSFEIENGRYFSLFEANSGKNVTILGADIADKLFENTDPIGKLIIIRGKKLRVIGVVKKEGVGGIGDNGFDETIMAPINFTRNLVDIRRESLNPMIIVKSRDDVPVEELRDDLTATLRAIRRLKPAEKDDFALNQASLISQGFESVFAGINVGGWIIGGFSILVGGFGIANIMFVSVKERTKIIGIQKALGAKSYFILQQFLYESVLLSLVGGLFGLILVLAGTVVMNKAWDLNIHLTLDNVLLAVFISGSIGVISGYTPARTAARLNPVDAIATTF